MTNELLTAFSKDMPIQAMRRQYAAALAEADDATAGGLAAAFADAGERTRRNILRFLVLRGGRFALAAFGALFMKHEPARPLFYEVLREAGLLGVNAVIEIRRRIPPAEEEAYTEPLSRLHEILCGTGHFDRLREFLDHESEKVILYALRQFYLFPTRETLELLRPIGEHPNWLVRHNILEIYLRTGADAALFAALDFLDDPEKRIREKIRDAVRTDVGRFYPILVRRFENPLDLKFNPVLALLGEIGRMDLAERLVQYVVSYRRPLNVKALDAFQQIVGRELSGYTEPFNPEGRHRRIALHLRTMILSGTAEVRDALADFIRRLGPGGIALLVREYDGSGSLEAENAEAVYRALRDEDDAARIDEFLARGDERECVNLVTLVSRKLGDASFLSLCGKLAESLPPDRLSLFLATLHRVRPGFPELHDLLLALSGRLEPPERRLAVLRFLGTAGNPRLLAKLETELDNPDPAHRIEILSLLGRFNNVEAVTVLKKAVDDPHPGVRRALLDALASIDTLEATVMLFYVFRGEIERGDETVAKIIAERGKERYFKYLDSMNEFFRKELGLTLANLSESFVDDVSANLASLDFAERSRALELLTLVAENRRDEVLEKLRALLNDPDDRMRAMLARTLAAIGGDAVADLTLSLLNDASPRVRANAIEILPLVHDKELYKHVYRFLRDENNRVRANAVMTLYKAGDRRVVLALADMLKSDDKWMRASAAFALGEIEDERTTPLLLGILNDPDLDVRRNAVKALGKVGGASCVKHLLPFLSQHDRALYDEASRAIAKIKGREGA